MFFDSKDFGLIGAEVMKEIAANTDTDNVAENELAQPQASFFNRLIGSLRHDHQVKMDVQPATSSGDDLASYLA